MAGVLGLPCIPGTLWAARILTRMSWNVSAEHSVGRTGRGSLQGTLALEKDWDSEETNEEIADEFVGSGAAHS